MRIRDRSRQHLTPLSMEHPGFLWSTGLFDSYGIPDADGNPTQPYVIAVAAYASEEERETANSRETAIGQAWWGGIAPMFPDFDCPCPMGFSPNICGEGRFAGVTDWITSGDGTPGSGCNPPGSGCLGGESCMCTSNEDCSNCAPSEGNIQGPFPIGPNGAHMKINAGGCVETISGQSEWSHSGRSPATGGADSRGVDPHQEAWLSASFDTWFLQGAAGCGACSDAEGNPVCPNADATAPIDPLPGGTRGPCGPDSICYENPWPVVRRRPVPRGLRPSATVLSALEGLDLLGSRVSRLRPGPSRTHPVAAAASTAAPAVPSGAAGAAQLARTHALKICRTGHDPEEAQTASCSVRSAATRAVAEGERVRHVASRSSAA